jgi:hypothetical protein
MAMQNKVYPFIIFKNKSAVRNKQTGVNVFFERFNHSVDVELPLLSSNFVKKYIILYSH